MTGASPLRTVFAPNPSPMTLDGTRTFIVGVRRPVVIDPGPDDERHLAAVRAALGAHRPEAILLTHEHADHAAGASDLARSTGAPLLHGRGALDPAFAGVAAAIGEGDEIETDAGVLRVIATPGHAPEHLAFHWTGAAAPDGGAVFVGDLMMGGSDTTLIAPPEGDLRQYLASLDRIEELGPGVIYPAHGPPIDHPIDAIARYRAHRGERIAQIRSALAARPDAAIEELVERIYGASIDPALRPAAGASVAAMLEYLRD